MRSMPRLSFPILLGLALVLPLTACSNQGADEAAVADLDNKLVGKGSDPEVNAALNGRILVDPDLTDNANKNSLKAATKPLAAAKPADSGYDGDASIEALDGAKLMRAPKATVVAAENCTNCGERRAATLGGLAADQGVTRGKGTCDAKLQYGAGWANRMPAEFPVYPRGNVKEAGGVDGGFAISAWSPLRHRQRCKMSLIIITRAHANRALTPNTRYLPANMFLAAPAIMTAALISSLSMQKQVAAPASTLWPTMAGK